jgi:hypothetical protein
MNAIFAKFFERGFRTTIADDLTPVWDREYRTRASHVLLIGRTGTD